MSTEGGSSHAPQDTTDEPSTFNIQILPAGSAPKDSTFKPNVGGELAPGQANNAADTTYDDKIDVKKGLGSSAEKEGKGEEEEGEHRVEIKSATEREPEGAESL